MAKRNIEIMHSLFGICDGHTCGECDNLMMHAYSRNYFKCAVWGNSCSVSSDWRKKYQACGMFNREYSDIPVKEYVKHMPRTNNNDEQIPGQMTVWDWIAEVRDGEETGSS